MLILGRSPEPAVQGDVYFDPVRFRPIFKPAYARIDYPKLRAKKESQVELDVDVKPRSRFSTKGTSSRIKSDNLTEEDADEEGNDDDDNESELPSKSKDDEKKKKKRKKNGKEKKGKGGEPVQRKYNSTIEHLCSKLRLSFVLTVLAGIILLACCCALFLRNRIAACCNKCCPRRKEKKRDPFDVERADYPYQTSGKTSLLKSNKKKKGNPKMIDTGIQDSRTSIAQTRDELPETVGCSPCCRKKKKKKKKIKEKRKP